MSATWWVGPVLVGDVRVEGDARGHSVAGVHDVHRLAGAARREVLAVGRGGLARAPEPGERQRSLRLDQHGQGALVGLLADVPVGGAQQLPERMGLAGVGHLAQPEVHAVGEDHGQEREPVARR